MNLELIVQIGWTGLLGWACLQAVSHGKALVQLQERTRRLPQLGRRVRRIEEKLNNGLTQELGELARDIRHHMDGEELRILAAIEKRPREEKAPDGAHSPPGARSDGP